MELELELLLEESLPAWRSALRWGSFLLSLLLSLSLSLRLQAQKPTGARISITGKVSDADGLLPGATVIVPAQSIGVLTDLDGRFTLSAQMRDTVIVVIRYLGYAEYRDTLIGVSEPSKSLGRITLQPSTQTLSTVDIVGGAKAGTDLKAYNMMQTSGQVISVMSSETMRKLPDKNAAETVRRMAGAAVQNNKGEGAYISLRGTPSDWTSTLMNGDRLPVADEDNASRTFEFEVLPSELLEYVILTRTSTPDQEGDNIGGTINFVTKNVPEKRTFYVSAGTGLNMMVLLPTVNLSLLYGDVSKNKKFAWLANVSYFGRYYGAQGMKLIFGNNFNHAMNRFELKDYDGIRHTVGANLALEYRITPRLKLGLKGLFSTMIDDKYQRKTMFVYASGENSGLWLQNVHGVLLRMLGGAQLSTEYIINDRLTLNVKAGSYWNSFGFGNVPFRRADPRNGYFHFEFRQKRTDIDYLDDVDIVTDGGAYDPSNPNIIKWGPAKLLDLDNPYGTGDNFRAIRPVTNFQITPDNLDFRRAFSQLNRTREQDPIVGQIDLVYKLRNDLTLKFGSKHRLKTGERYISLHTWIPNVPVTQSKIFPLSSFPTESFNERGGYMRPLTDAYNGSFFPFLSRSFMNDVGGYFTAQGDSMREYPMNEFNQEYKLFIGSNYTYEEMQNAGYAMFDWRPLPKLQLVGGLRLEHTYMNQWSDDLDTSRLVTLPDPNNPGGFISFNPPFRVRARLDYLAVLPSLNINYSLRENMNLRFAISRTFHRPNFEETKPGAAVINYADFEYTFGNPQLKPAYSLNLDLMYELYWGDLGVLSLGAYYKYVTDHIFHVTTGDVNQITGIVIKQFRNANESWVFGVELNLTRKFDFLPGFLNGFGVSGNFTYSVSRMQVPGREAGQAMAEQTPILFNASLFYEKYGFSARIALNYTGAFLDALNLAAVTGIGLLHKDSRFDIFQGENYSLDLQLGYEFKRRYAVFFEAYNLLDWPYYEYRGDARRPTRYEYYRQRLQVGFRFTL